MLISQLTYLMRVDRKIMKNKLNIKIKIDKSQSKTIAYIAVASFLLVFGLFTSKTLFGLYIYQGRVITAQKTSISNIASDQKVANNVVTAYKQFVNQTINIIGGPSTGVGSTAGNNSKIILDALPQTYDFPATMSSMQALISIPGVIVDNLTGVDNSLTVVQAIQPTPIPVSFSVSGTYASIQTLLGDLNRSVMPLDILSIQLNGTDSYLTASISAQVYYYNPPSGIITSTETIQ